jgi:hypothetical protein
MSELIQNKVADSGIISLNLEQFYPKQEIVPFDLKPYLFMELLLKEKDFRQSLQDIDWNQFLGKSVAVFCSSDAIIPVWAYMLVASYLQPYAAQINMGSPEKVTQDLLLENMNQLNLDLYKEQRVVVKGCGELPVSEQAYMKITHLLRPVVKSIMYGEPCSTVPVYKKKP